HQTTFTVTNQTASIPVQTNQLGQRPIIDILTAVSLGSYLKIDPTQLLTNIGNANGLYYDQHHWPSVNDIRLVDLLQPWSVDAASSLTHLRQHFMPDQSAKFWLVCPTELTPDSSA